MTFIFFCLPANISELVHWSRITVGPVVAAILAGDLVKLKLVNYHHSRDLERSRTTIGPRGRQDLIGNQVANNICGWEGGFEKLENPLMN